MVSLINFKTVNEELRPARETVISKEQELPAITVVKSDQDQVQLQVEERYSFQIGSNLTHTDEILNLAQADPKLLAQDNGSPQHDSICNRSSSSESSNVEHLSYKSTGRSSDFQPSADSLVVAPGDRQNFVVTWRSLRYVIEPKWHQHILDANPISSWTKRACRSFVGEQKAEIASSEIEASSPTNKMVLDRLDGSFRSGELTAVLGPSGKLLYLDG